MDLMQPDIWYFRLLPEKGLETEWIIKGIFFYD